jgi:tRNA 2-thiocytidine biosynthesis protein TtcA
VLRPLIYNSENDIARYAALKEFPILPCNLCSNQANLQRPQMKLLLKTLEHFNPNAKQNLLNAMGNIRPTHMLDQRLRQACGIDPVTGEGAEDCFDDENEEL